MQLDGTMKSRLFSRISRLRNPVNLLKHPLFIGFGLFLCIDAFSQQKTLQFKHLSLDNGLSSSIVRSVLQDYKGFMWLGTFDQGLNRYDGNKIIVYKNNPSDPNSLPENMVRALFEDHNKKLFIGTGGGLSEYDRDLNRFINFKFEKASPLYNLAMSVYKIVEDTLGNLWLASDNGLFYFDRSNNKVVQYKHDPNIPGSISANTMEGLFFDKRGRLWVGTRKGLNLFNPTTGTFQLITQCKTHVDNIADVCFMDILEDKQGNLWLGSESGLFCLEKNHAPNKLELSHFKANPLDQNSLTNDRIRTLLIDHAGNLWIGTENGGINIYNHKKNTFSRYRIEEFNSMSLNNESIHAMTEDRSNNIWVCTWGGGVNIASYKSGFIIPYKNLPGAQQSLSFNIVSGFVEDRFGRIWAGTDGGGFNLFNDTTGRFIRFNSYNTSIKSDAIITMQKGMENQIWMGTWEGGLVQFDYTNNTVHSLTTANSGNPDNSIFSMAQDSIGNLWLGSYKHGLVYYQRKENKYTTFSPKQVNILNTEIAPVRLDHKGQVYLATNNGSEIFLFNPKENRYIPYNIIPDTLCPKRNAVFDILAESDTCTWVATQLGLCRINPVKNSNTWYFRKDGTTETTAKGLTLDKTGILWVTTTSGLYRLDYRKNSLKHFTTSDGLPSNDFVKSSILTTKNGSILAGTTNGFCIVSPEKYSENRSIPQVVITDFHIFNEKVKILAQGSPLKKQISETEKITLSYKQSVLTFYFAVLDFSSPDRNQYAYQMENFDKDWIYCGDKKDATYTNLNPGRYRFHVKGSNNDGIWNEEGTTVELVITPPWWKTNVARAGFILVIIFILLWIYYYFRGKQEQKHLREMVASQKKIENIMNAIDEAIFTVNMDMTINKEHSKIAEKIFGTTEFETKNISSLFNMDEKIRANFGVWIELAFKRKWTAAGWEKHLRLNPIKEVILEREGKIYLSVQYQPIYENNVLSRIMVLVNDITVQKRVEQYLTALNDEKELQMERVFGLVSNDYDSVISILDLGKNVIQSFELVNLDAPEKCKPRLKELGRDLHTLKGTGGSMTFDTLAKHCDELEAALIEYMAEKDHSGSHKREHITKTFDKLTREIQSMVELRTKLYSGKEDKLGVDKSDYENYLESLKKGGFRTLEESIYRFRMLTALKFSEFCAEFSKMVADYSSRFEKSIEPMVIVTPDAKVERKVCKAFKGPVTHLIRNAIDHGIEDDAVRAKLGKGPGHITMALRDNNGMIELEITDDGAGIDPERVAASAIKKGIITTEQAQNLTGDEKRDLIFLHGFSTKEETTTVSGRGVGMDAVKTDIAKVGGNLKIISTVGKGTQMILSIPNVLV
jgi:ligand-binding sensor domain-containing protein/HPt (histidine-containing phosphotransfer) domain-containing protein